MLNCYNNEWHVSETQDPEKINLNIIKAKFWMTSILQCTSYGTPNLLSSDIKHFYRVNAKSLVLTHLTVSFNEFIFLSSNVEYLNLDYTIVKNEGGSIVQIENLLKVLPKVKRVLLNDNVAASSINKNTLKEFLKLPNLSKIKSFQLVNITETFDIDAFFTNIIKNNKLSLYFFPVLSKAYKNRVEAVIDEIINSQNHDYKVPCIMLPGIDDEKHDKMIKLHRQF